MPKKQVTKILKEVLSEITPDAKEKKQITSQANNFLKELNKALKKQKASAKAVLGGSFAKNTWLKGDYDVDVFVKFDLKYENKNISDLLEKALKKKVFERVPGSRDYFWVKQDRIKYEIVPVLDIKKSEQAQNVTDFSPLHVKWVNKEGKNLKQDIRLAKKFCKAQGVYGAESYIKGFSGHVVDILVIYYKGFLKLLKAAAKWKPKEIIDYYHVYDKKAFLRLNKSKIQGPLIVIDPLQKDRNAAAAVGNDKFYELVNAAKKFLKNPGKKFFVEQKTDFSELAKKGHLIRLSVTTKKSREDITGNRLLQAYEHVKNSLKEFGIITSGWEWDKKTKAEFWYVLKTKKLPETKIHPGPPTKFKEAVKKFKKKHKNTFVKNKKVFARVKRKIRTPAQAVKQAAQSEYVKSRKSIVTIKQA